MLERTMMPDLGDDNQLRYGRFGLYDAENGQPVQLVGRFENFHDVMRHCEGLNGDKVVEIARYAYLPVNEFRDLFGPYQRAR